MGCIYCLKEIEFFSCLDACLISSNISPIYVDIAIVTLSLALISVFLSFAFKNKPKRSLGLKLLGISSMATGLITFGFIFSEHWFLKNIPFIIPMVGIISYTTSYFLSFYLIKLSYKPKLLKNKLLSTYAKKASKRLGIKKPYLYVFNSKKSQAFLVDGYKKAIFLSKVLIKKLDYNSLKSIILHELYHLKRRSALWKNVLNSLGNLTFRILPVPIEEFEKIEEEEIDKILLKIHNIDMNRIRKKL